MCPFLRLFSRIGLCFFTVGTLINFFISSYIQKTRKRHRRLKTVSLLLLLDVFQKSLRSCGVHENGQWSATMPELERRRPKNLICSDAAELIPSESEILQLPSSLRGWGAPWLPLCCDGARVVRCLLQVSGASAERWGSSSSLTDGIEDAKCV